MPRESESAVVDLRGTWVLAGDTLLSVGETDWTSPYWDANRVVRLVDVWEGGSIAGTITLADGSKGDEGGWELRQEDGGGLLLAWTAMGVLPAAVPEASTFALGAGSLLLALSARRRRARPR